MSDSISANETPVTLAFVGCSHIHFPGLRDAMARRPDVQVTALWDADPAKAEAAASHFPGCRVASDPTTIAGDASVAAVALLGETNLHDSHVPIFAAAGKHLFVEKPIGIGADDARRIAEAIEKAGVLFSTGYYHRAEPKIVFLREQIQAGAFGKITRARMSNCHSGALGGWFDTEWRWMADPKIAGVGAFGDLGTHVLDALLWMLGPVKLATARISAGTARYPGCDETGEGLLEFENGVVATMTAAWDDVDDPVKLIISGTEGHATIFRGQLYFQSAHVEGADGKTPWTTLPDPSPWGLDALVDAVQGKPTPALCPVRDAAYACAVMEAMYKGNHENRWATP
jgi:hypothetical protein